MTPAEFDYMREVVRAEFDGATEQLRAELAELVAEVDSLRALVELITGKPLPPRVSPPARCLH
jgi:hypothetical protein